MSGETYTTILDARVPTALIDRYIDHIMQAVREKEPTVIDLKIRPEFFGPVARGEKPFEIRKDDRGGFRPGDTLRLREWEPATERYTGREAMADVTYVTDFAQQPGYVVMGIRVREEPTMTTPEPDRDAGLDLAWREDISRTVYAELERHFGKADWGDVPEVVIDTMLAALPPEPSLEEVLAGVDAQRIVLYRWRHHRIPNWSAHVQTGHGGKADPQGIGTGPTIAAAMRNAVAAAGEGE